MSSINPVGRSMNGIKTIETASLIFTDDNSSLNTSAGIVSAQANSTTALNGKINSVGFNTSNGVLTLTKEDGGTLTKDLDGRYLESLDADDIPNLPASKITSGTFGTARIPDLNASKITAGTLGDARIPNLNASKINAGTLGTARIPDLPYVSVGTSGTHTDETIFGVKTFNEFPTKSGSSTALNPTADNQYATKKYVDDNTIINHSFHASFNTPNAGNMFFDQGIVFKPNYIWFNIGNRYNSSTGKFTATIRGVYMFKFSAFTNQAAGYISRPSLYKNGYLRISSGNTIAQNGNQVFAIIDLDIGDAVHLTSAYGRYYMYSHYAYNQFSGSLISTY